MSIVVLELGHQRHAPRFGLDDRADMVDAGDELVALGFAMQVPTALAPAAPTCPPPRSSASASPACSSPAAAGRTGFSLSPLERRPRSSAG
jgi:hypothetical protein